MKTGALILSFSLSFLSGLLASAPPADAEMLAATVQSPQLAGFLGDLDMHGFKVRRIVPVPASTVQVCTPCVTLPTGYTLCADPTAPPQAPFCHQAPAIPALQVLYERR
jgi:hypothetical protein